MKHIYKTVIGILCVIGAYLFLSDNSSNTDELDDITIVPILPAYPDKTQLASNAEIREITTPLGNASRTSAVAVLDLIGSKENIKNIVEDVSKVRYQNVESIKVISDEEQMYFSNLDLWKNKIIEEVIFEFSEGELSEFASLQDVECDIVYCDVSFIFDKKHEDDPIKNYKRAFGYIGKLSEQGWLTGAKSEGRIFLTTKSVDDNGYYNFGFIVKRSDYNL